MPPLVIAESNRVFTTAGIWSSRVGCAATPRPTPNEAAMISTLRRSIAVWPRMRMPAAATLPNITRVAPPSTGLGICWRIAPIQGNRPSASNTPPI